MAVGAGADGPDDSIHTASMTGSDLRRAREFYRYLQPVNLVAPSMRRRGSTFGLQHEHVPSLSTALKPFCQLAVLRCNAHKALLNVMDRNVMYFLAEALRAPPDPTSTEAYEFIEDPIMASCSKVALKGRICELTIRLDKPEVEPVEQFPMFVIPNLLESDFKDMEIVQSGPKYRFYAGTPIITHDGVNIGSLAIMDTKIRQGLTPGEEQFLGETAQQVMVYLETNRQAIEGRRSRRMAQGLEGFIAGNRTIDQEGPRAVSDKELKRRSKAAYGIALASDIQSESLQSPTKAHSNDNSLRRKSVVGSIFSDLDSSETSTDSETSKAQAKVDGDSRSHFRTFARAANLLRESLGDLGDEGSVTFVSLKSRLAHGAAKSTTPRRFPDHHRNNDSQANGLNRSENHAAYVEADKPAVLATSTSTLPFVDASEHGSQSPKPTAVDNEVLRELMRRYPGGRVWSFEDDRFSSSDETGTEGRHAPTSKPDLALPRPSRRRRRDEANLVWKAFPDARQLLFAPLWDPNIGSFAHAVFVSTTSEIRSLTSSTELSFVNSFCSTVMAECNRLDTMMADKQKSDFVGTISHEMRSPLHGILASVEFLADTDLNLFQRSLIDTVDSCGRTLLDTINHVLDFSKVNSFQKHWQASNEKAGHGSKKSHYLGPNSSAKSFSNGAPPLLQLYAITDVSAVLEEVVEGLVLGQNYNSGLDITDISREARGKSEKRSAAGGEIARDAVEMIVDVQSRDWSFMTQPGAVRRIIMNITGNAMKYTSSGSITVRLALQEGSSEKGADSVMLLTVTDTGRGITPQFLSSKLFVPFAQENALAPGTGLGLSIVHSIVTMLGGTIDVKSQVGKGTTVQVALPMKRPLPGQRSTINTPLSGGTAISTSSSGDDSIPRLQTLASDARVAIYKRLGQSEATSDDLHHILSSYVTDWYHMELVEVAMIQSATVVLVEEKELESLMNQVVGTPGTRPAIVVLCSVASRHDAAYISALENRVTSAVEFVAKPCGPYKLARNIRHALEKKNALKPRYSHISELAAISEQPTPPTANTLVHRISDELQEMDLNTVGHNDASQMVQANETFAASQSSQHAQMAITDPSSGVRSPSAPGQEASSFPFPSQNTAEDTLGPPRPNEQPQIPQTTVERAKPQPALRFTEGSNSDQNNPPSKVDPRVLLVDDNKINLKLLETFLKVKRKYTKIVQAEDGQQAVDAVMVAQEPFEIVFMDISMPLMNGFEATRAIRDHEQQTNIKTGAMVIALTGLASGRDQSEGFDSGCDIYMTKPVAFKEVGKLLDNWEAHQRLREHDAGVDLDDFKGAVAGSVAL